MTVLYRVPGGFFLSYFPEIIFLLELANSLRNPLILLKVIQLGNSGVCVIFHGQIHVEEDACDLIACSEERICS